MLDDQQLAEVFKALSNPHRLAIYRRLARCCAPGTACDVGFATSRVGELGEELDIAASTLSHHLKSLSHCGLIRMLRRGQCVECSVNPDMLNQLGQFFGEPLIAARQEISDE